MSFGFSVGDFITVGEIAWRLYRDCYKIARGAPQEFQLLVGEISTLSHSFSLLQEEVKDPQSPLVLAGEDRVRMVNEMVHSIGLTLKALEKVAKKYEILGSASKKRHIWVKFKWSVDLNSLNSLRNKLVYHNTVMNLLLTSVGNSSLQRIESSTDALESDVREIKSYITERLTEQLLIPSISNMDDESESLTLTASLMQNAEVLQPWSTIGVDQWIESGRWWLLRSQVELHTDFQTGQKVPLAAYTSLIKASWILIDIISCHPQVPFLSTTTRLEVQILSTELKAEFQRLQNLKAVKPSLKDLESQDLRIWESQARGPLLRSQVGPGNTNGSRSEDQWRVEGGEQVLFQNFALVKTQALPDAIPCIVLFLIKESNEGKSTSARISVQNQNGSVIMAMSFEKIIEVAEREGCVVTLNNEQVNFTSTRDTQMLCSLVEGANFHHCGTLIEDWTKGDFDALVLLFAIKAQRHETAARLLQKLQPEAPTDEDPTEYLPAIASSLAVSQVNGTLNDNLCPENKTPRDELPLLQWAIECNHVGLATKLMSKDVVGTQGNTWRQMTPLSLACRCGHEAIAREFIKHLSTENFDRRWLLSVAARYGHPNIVKLLLCNGAEIDSRDNEGLTPLGHAARNGHVSTVEVLISRGANMEIECQNQFTPLHEACEAKQEAVIALLAERGAKFNVYRYDSMLPYHVILFMHLSKRIYDIAVAKTLTQNFGKPPPLPALKRTASVAWTVDSDWAVAMIGVEEGGRAWFEHPDPLPVNVTNVHNQFIRIGKPPEAPRAFYKWTYWFNLVFHGENLRIAIGHGSWSSTDYFGKTQFEIGTRSPVKEKGTSVATISTTTRAHPTNFESPDVFIPAALMD